MATVTETLHVDGIRCERCVGRLAGALLGNGLAERFYWIQSPLWLGDRGVPAVSGLPSEPIARAERWRVVERRALENDTLLVVDRG